MTEAAASPRAGDGAVITLADRTPTVSRDALKSQSIANSPAALTIHTNSRASAFGAYPHESEAIATWTVGQRLRAQLI